MGRWRAGLLDNLGQKIDFRGPLLESHATATGLAVGLDDGDQKAMAAM
jgi:hypothetical protein